MAEGVKNWKVGLVVQGDLETGLAWTARKRGQSGVAQGAFAGQQMAAANPAVGAGEERVTVNQRLIVGAESDDRAAA